MGLLRNPRAIARGVQIVKLRLARICCGDIEREVSMRTSGATTAYGRLPWSQGPALAQFHPDPALRDFQSADTGDRFFATRTEPGRTAPVEISFGPFRLLPTQFLLLEDDQPVSLGSRALEILIVLLERPGELVSKQQLMARVWPNVFVEPANLTVHMSALRRTLRDRRDGNRFIINVPGRGYSFVASVAVAGWIEPDGDEDRHIRPDLHLAVTGPTGTRAHKDQ